MKKRKGKRRIAAKTTRGKTSPNRKNCEPSKLEELRKDLVKMVEAEAEELANAVIAEGKKGQLATVKYLFEMS